MQIRTRETNNADRGYTVKMWRSCYKNGGGQSSEKVIEGRLDEKRKE